MKFKYPIEAFALAMIVYTRTFIEAWQAGIILLFVTTLCLVIDSFFLQKLPQWSRRLCITILTVSVTYALFEIVFKGIMGTDLTTQHTIIHLSLGALMAIHILQVGEDADYNGLLLQGAGAYAIMLIMGLLREFLAVGEFIGVEIADFVFTSSNFQSIAMGLLFAGIGIAILNKIFKQSSIRLSSLFVLIPIALIEQPFSLGFFNETVSTLLSIVVVLILFISVRMDLVFSRISKEWKGLPIEMVSMSFIYLILVSVI